MSKHPGKFEGEPDYVEYFYAVWGDGMESDGVYDHGRPVAVFYISDEDIEHWPDLAGEDNLILWEDDNGFVHHRLLTNQQLSNYRKDCEEVSDNDIRNPE